MIRWLKFNLVGLFGAVIQLLVIWTSVHLFQFHYLASTILGVEIAIIHNFAWHVLWTFSDRHSDVRYPYLPTLQDTTSKKVIESFLKFQLSAGVISIPGNLLVMWLLVKYLNLNLAVANSIAIAACATVNFLVADRFSFRHNDLDPEPCMVPFNHAEQ